MDLSNTTTSGRGRSRVMGGKRAFQKALGVGTSARAIVALDTRLAPCAHRRSSTVDTPPDTRPRVCHIDSHRGTNTPSHQVVSTKRGQLRTLVALRRLTCSAVMPGWGVRATSPYSVALSRSAVTVVALGLRVVTPSDGVLMAARVDVTFPHQGVAQLLLDSPPKNFLTWELMGRLEEALIRVRDEGYRVVVLGSAVDEYFVAHGHIDNMVDTFAGGPEVPGDPSANIRVQKELDTGPMISIAAVDAQAWGGGAELAWACDFRVASETATFGQPEVMVGLPPAGGGVRISRLAGEAIAKQLIIDGRPVSGAEAFRLGLVHRLVPAGEALAAALDWAEWLSGRSEGALAFSKSIIVGGRDLALGDALRQETTEFVKRFSNPEVVQLARQVQERYDKGADSYEAFGVERP